jgi:glycosyltransferase involved in cell wall biosynthesis
MKWKVVISQHRLLHYRVELFTKLRSHCAENDIELTLVHGKASRNEQIRNDEGNLEWANVVNNIAFRLGGRDLLWQPMPSELKGADLIILMQENRIISNYKYLLTPTKLRSSKLGYWGHGVNFQSQVPDGLRERWKKYLINKVDWWFAYTEITENILTESGFPHERITNLNNAVDTNKFKSDFLSVSEKEVEDLKKNLSISQSAKVGVFCGSLYKDKKLDLLLSAAELVRETIDFHIIVLGAGPELDMLKRFSKDNPWIHLVGVKKAYEKAAYFKVAEVMLNPGSLGLHILDSFSIGIPLVSTINAKHGPEIAYFENGKNGILTEDIPEEYAKAVIKLIEDKDFYQKIAQGALKSSEKYTLDNMVSNFVEGIQKALSV